MDAFSNFFTPELAEPKPQEPEASASNDSIREMPVPDFYSAGERKPNHPRLNERPEHRQMCLLAAQGLTAPEIAEITGFRRETVNDVLKEVWARAYITQLMHQTGAKAAIRVLSGAALKAAKHLVDCVDGSIEGIKVSDQTKAAIDILDRITGTPTHKVEVTRRDASELSDQELASMVGQN